MEDLILIAKTITNVVDNTKSGNSNRSTILNVCVIVNSTCVIVHLEFVHLIFHV